MKKQSTTKGFAILSMAALLVKVISLLYVPFLIHILGPAGYGIYSAIYQVFLFAYVITNSGISVAISKLIAEHVTLGNYKDAVRTFKLARVLMLLVGAVACLIMILLARPLANLLEFPEAALGIRVLAPTILITPVLSVYRGYFQGRANMVPTAMSQVMEQIVNTVFSLLFAAILFKYYGVAAGAAGGTVGTTLGALLSIMYLSHYYKENKSFKVPVNSTEHRISRYSNKELIRKIIKYSFPITICLGMQNAGGLVDTKNVKNRLLFAGFSKDVANTKYGYLGGYNTLINVPITLISALSAASLPALSSAVAKKDRTLLKAKINYVFRLCFLVAVPCAVGLTVLSKPIYMLLFPRMVESYVLIKYGAIVVVIWAVVQTQTTILQSLGKLYAVTFYSIIGITIKIISNYILVSNPSVNVNGVIIGNVICFTIILILNHRLITKSLRVRFGLLRHAIKPTLAALAMGAVTYIAYYDIAFLLYVGLKLESTSNVSNMISIIITIPLAGFVYSYVLILVGGVTKNDLGSLSPKIIRFIPKFMINELK